MTLKKGEQERHRSEMTRRHTAIILTVALFVTGCMGSSQVKDYTLAPIPVIYEDETTTRFRDADDDKFIEIRKTPTSRPIENLAIHYPALFPGGEIIRPGDTEEYTMINGKNSYKVVFRTKYIRKRKRLNEKQIAEKEDIPAGWTKSVIEDTASGSRIPIMLGPVVPQHRILYLVPGDHHVYYLFMRVDGENYDQALKDFDRFVREEVSYK
jgi:hypothetical protein